MNIQELGSLGEFVGAIAVMVTLVYLAIQTRLTRKAAEVTQRAAEETAKYAGVQAGAAVVEGYSRWRMLMSKPDIAKIIVKAREDESLTDEEQVIYSAVFEELIYSASASFESSVESASFHTVSADVKNLLAVFKANPRVIAEWHRVHDITVGVSSRFVETIDSLLKEQEIAQQGD
ncbi:MAG: hypothetical protein DRR06_05375 [Gammaproteobacteria bacterium]|nr:MAG: hypothetical protein DRR06_05375 [Gammaproteobacteria bacterium]RLA54325.1 MAG: hypothetical protein DRR42_02075 [Gammaproteobacteria bacterium]